MVWKVAVVLQVEAREMTGLLLATESTKAGGEAE